MSNVLRYLPELEGDEQVEVARLLNDMSDAQAEHFARIYRSRRRDPDHILILAAVGFVGAAGLQRLYTGKVALGLVYLFTGGLCLIGTIYDVIKYQDLAFRYNRDVALEVAETVRTVYDTADDGA
ncbi:TM2 domain-containing membrane protein YozV [Salinibacter ruber]|uniref:TM2 domain-containing protein n=1 Tax=Salinibacter ruber TaxID=146919 RepID=UPI001ABBC857|nr:TM2 domain-containing protein [Salinibacter ruber]MCS3748969.1 TM2 domain-containing membrane protein YozV [Salinibacter ruber]MCS3753506.1 TM2 domain-containing membrane protein YozV [Salinibacter ruber]